MPHPRCGRDVLVVHRRDDAPGPRARGHGGDRFALDAAVDVNDKVEFYAGIPSIRHYLVIEQDRRRVLYHGRGPSGALEPRIIRAGEIPLDPPGIRLAVEALYRETALAEG